MDVCQKCLSARLKLKDPRLSDEEKKPIEEQYKQHQVEAAASVLFRKHDHESV